MRLRTKEPPKHHLRTPSQQLGRGDKLVREALHRRALTIGLLLVLVTGVIAALLELGSWGAWVVLGGICVTVIGVIVAVSPTRPA